MFKTCTDLLVPLLIIFAVVEVAKANSCNSRQFECGNGICIFLQQRCDGVRNCLDFSDERGCKLKTECSGAKDRNGKCITGNWNCDDEDDCLDGSGDKDLDVTNGCTGFQCRNGRCITTFRKCDGYADCEDNSDEEATLCQKHSIMNSSPRHAGTLASLISTFPILVVIIIYVTEHHIL